MKKVFKSIIANVLIIAIICGVCISPDNHLTFFTIESSATIIDSGTSSSSISYGKNISWTLDNNGVLNLSGKGDMHLNYPNLGALGRHNARIKSVVISPQITSIDKGTFSCCENLTSINIPNSVKSIGESAFIRCKKLKSINIPAGISVIEKQTFDQCDSLNSITIPKTVKTIREGAFSNCSSLKTIIIPNGVTKIEYGTFCGCKNLTEVNLPDSVTSIETSAFRVCDKLKEFVVPKHVTKLGDYVFERCTRLKYIVIPETVTSIGSCAFDQCDSLERIYYSGSEKQWMDLIDGSVLNDGPQCIPYNCSIKYNYPKTVSPNASATVSNGKLTLKWKALPGATKYAVATVKKNKKTYISKKITETTCTLQNLAIGKTHVIIVQAYVNGKWSASSDPITVEVNKDGSMEISLG